MTEKMITSLLKLIGDRRIYSIASDLGIFNEVLGCNVVFIDGECASYTLKGEIWTKDCL